jgi:cell division protein FtsI (penicillin-binding protein 3)
VIQNLRGEVVENVEQVREPAPGRELKLSIDHRLQYLAFRELGNGVTANKATSGSMVILDVATGEILAMVNWPTFNPNARASGRQDVRRNRAVTDLIEPGSVAKAFTVSAGLESGKFQPTTMIDTNPGTLLVGNHIVRDVSNHGVVDLTGLIQKSSNVGATKIALELSNDHLFDVFHRFGFGQTTGSGFPGEAAGVLPEPKGWGVVEKATISYGYGFSATPLQLAAAYAALGNGGRLHAPTFVAGARNPDVAVLDPQIARTLVGMLESVVGPGGTGTKAAVPNFRVAGKTGTSHKAAAGGYQNRYVSVFAGLIPASAPRLVGVVVIDDPQAGVHFGGTVAAPVFGRVMSDAVRLLDMPPDRLDQRQAVNAPNLPLPPPASDDEAAEGAMP